MEDFKEMLGFGNFLRSAEMEYISFITQEHLAYSTVRKLGSLSAVQFSDLNGDLTAFKRTYTPFVKRCDDLEHKLKFFEEEIALHGLPMEDVPQGEYGAWESAQQDLVSRDHRGMSLLDYWEAVISERHKDYLEVKAQRDRTAAGVYQAVQRRFVIEKAAAFFALEQEESSLSSSSAAVGSGVGVLAEVSFASSASSMEAGESTEKSSSSNSGNNAAIAGEAAEMRFKHIAGILSTDDKVRFNRIVFRASFGQAVVRFADIPVDLLDEHGNAHAKSVFAVFYRGKSLTSKLDRICQAFSASMHDIPNFARTKEVISALAETRGVISDSLSWLEQERHTSAAALTHLALLVKKWKMGVQREKATYHTLNMFSRNVERGTLESQCWVLKSSVEQVQETVRSVHVAAAAGGRISPFYFQVIKGDSLPTPPTFFPTNKFTAAFQGFVDTYGIPRYREANPALFAIATFPFLFGVMYGDVGHALIISLAAAWVVWNEKALAGIKEEMFTMVFGGRYILLGMGLCAVYCGMIYNDIFSLGATPYVTAWRYVGESKEATWSGKATDVYPFGIDPEWHISENNLLFFNSLKMKMSIVIGVTQMTFGLLLKTGNAVYFGNMVDLFCECIPQVIFMLALFGYMVFLIILKWSIDWRDPNSRPGAPPSLIDTMINLALKPGGVSDPMYEGQIGVQTLILLVVFICVPIMLFVKPYLESAKHAAAAAKKKADLKGEHKEESDLLGGGGHDIVAHGGGHGGGGHEDHSFGELFIHQAIETIEFVLGSVSNTASYLRLWALSLAHSQLATVFWERCLVSSIEMNSTVGIIIGYGAFAGISFSVLLCMDVLECFLHALRLHWVEFQNKFYKADGYKFSPFSFAAIAEASE